MTTYVKIDYSKLNTQKRKDKASRIQREMHVIVNSKQFKNKFLQLGSIDFPIDGERSLYREMSSVMLYEYFMNGSEVLTPEIDGVINIEFDDYFRRFSRVIGWTKRSINTVYVNTKFFDVNSDKLAGSNLIHEYSHKKGFNHDSRVNALTRRSLSYMLNIIYEQCHDEIFGKEVDIKPILPGDYKNPSLWSKFKSWVVGLF